MKRSKSVGREYESADEAVVMTLRLMRIRQSFLASDRPSRLANAKASLAVWFEFPTTDERVVSPISGSTLFASESSVAIDHLLRPSAFLHRFVGRNPRSLLQHIDLRFEM